MTFPLSPASPEVLKHKPGTECAMEVWSPSSGPQSSGFPSVGSIHLHPGTFVSQPTSPSCQASPAERGAVPVLVRDSEPWGACVGWRVRVRRGYAVSGPCSCGAFFSFLATTPKTFPLRKHLLASSESQTSSWDLGTVTAPNLWVHKGWWGCVCSECK